MSERSSRTRTLIQLGGLISKTKFLDLFDITLGEDLQSENDNSYKGVMLLGLLKDLADQLPHSFTDDQLAALKEKGMITLRKNKH